MNCEELLSRICDELGEDIDSKVCLEIKAHLEKCADCREQVDSVRSTINLFRCIKDETVPLSVHERLIKMLNVEDVGVIK